eukprot:6089735-Alexandrium_andersonii.AAC.1
MRVRCALVAAAAAEWHMLDANQQCCTAAPGIGTTLNMHRGRKLQDVPRRLLVSGLWFKMVRNVQ